MHHATVYSDSVSDDIVTCATGQIDCCTCHVLGHRRSRLPEGEPLAFGGLVKAGTTGKGKGSAKRLFLGARYWQRAWSGS